MPQLYRFSNSNKICLSLFITNKQRKFGTEVTFNDTAFLVNHSNKTSGSDIVMIDNNQQVS